MEQTMELRGKLGFLEDQVKLAIMAFQQDDLQTLQNALSYARGAIEDLQKSYKASAA